MPRVSTGYTKAQEFTEITWPGVGKIPLDTMWSSCAAGIIGEYCYQPPENVIRSVANALEYHGKPYKQIVGDPDKRHKTLYSLRRAFLVFADGGDMKERGGKALEAYIQKHNLGPVTTLGEWQNPMYTQDHPCQIWLWRPDYAAVDKHVAGLDPVKKEAW